MPDVPTRSIHFEEDRIGAPDYSRRAARELLGVEAIELPGGHAPMASRPEALAKLLTAQGPAFHLAAVLRWTSDERFLTVLHS